MSGVNAAKTPVAHQRLGLAFFGRRTRWLMAVASQWARASQLSLWVIAACFLISLPATAEQGIWSATLGPQKALILVGNFQDNPSYQPYSISSIQNFFFGTGPTINSFFMENSYGQAPFSGDVFGYHTVPIDGSSFDLNAFIQDMNNAATAAGYNLSQYNWLIYLCESTEAWQCSGAMPEALLGYPESEPRVLFNGGGGLSSGTFGDLRVTPHEMGHALGLTHSHALLGATSLDGSGNVVPIPPSGSSPTYVEYGDQYDVMGSGSVWDGKADQPFDYNPYQKELLGWLNGGATPTMPLVTQSGQYHLNPYESATPSGTLALKIPKAKGSSSNSVYEMYYYLSCRKNLGNFDGTAFNLLLNGIGGLPGLAQNVNGGVLVHVGTFGNDINQMNYNWESLGNYALDMTPGNALGGSDLGNPALTVGKTFNDPESGVSFTTVSADSSGCDVDVKLSTGTLSGTRRLPSLSVSRPDTVSSGQPATYTVTITNNDDPSVGPATFGFSTAPDSSGAQNGNCDSAGACWSLKFSPATLSIAGGASATTTLTVTSPPSARGGEWSFYIVADNVDSPFFTNQIVSNYATTGPSGTDTTVPTVTFQSPANGATISGVLNVVASGVDSTTWIVKTELYVDGALYYSFPGQEIAPQVYTAGLSNGSHTFTAKAYDPLGNVGTQSITVTVSNPNTTPLSVALTSPAAGAVISGNLSLTATASGQGITSVTYLVDNGWVGQQSVSPYSLSVSTTTLGIAGGPLPNGPHTIAAVVTDSSGNRAISAPVNVTFNNPGLDTTPPSAPTGLTATALSGTQVKLSWNLSTDNVGVAGYYIQRIQNHSATQIPVNINTNSFVDSGLSPSTAYFYMVQAYDLAQNRSNQSMWAVVTTLGPSAPTLPSAPTWLMPVPITSTQISITWNASSSPGIVGYDVFRNGAKVATVSTLGYIDTGLSPSTTYSYTIDAYDAAGNHSAQSSAVSGTTPASTAPPSSSPPSVPSGLKVQAISSTQLNLSWNASTGSAGIFDYIVSRNGSVIATVNGNVLSYSDTGLSPSTTYSYTVAASDNAGNRSAQSSAVSGTTLANAVPPSVPSGLAVKAFSSTQLNLSWNASTGSAAGYDVFRNGLKIASTSAPSYSDTGLSPSTSYSYTIDAYDAAGNHSAQSSAVSGTTLANATLPPSVPSGLAVKAFSSTQLNLSWNASTGSAAGYDVFRNGLKIASTSAPSYSDTGLSPSTSYSYTIDAYDAAGNHSAQSSAVSGTTLANTVPPSVPSGLTANVVAGNAVSLSWNASTDAKGAVAGYKVYRNGNLIATTAQLTYLDSNLSPATYSYTVAAYDSAGNLSAQSAAVGVVVPDATPPSVPNNLKAIAASASQMTLTWTRSTDNVGVAGYKVYRNGTQIGTSTTTTSYLDANLTPATSYTYTVAAYDAAGNTSSQSTPVSGTTLSIAAPSAPTGLSATVISSSQIALSWSASTGAAGVAGYKVYRNGTQIGTSTTTTSYLDANLTPATSYTYTVAAYDAAGNNSAPSSEASATTSVEQGVPPVSVPVSVPVSILSPADGAVVSGKVTVEIAVSPGTNVTKIEYYVNDALVHSGLETSFTLDVTSSSPAGSSTSNFRAKNAIGAGVIDSLTSLFLGE